MFKGSFYAFMAAFLNALVGILSLSLFAKGDSVENIVFYKCVVAVIFLSGLVFSQTTYRAQLKTLFRYRYQVAVLAFFGIFCLYYFETTAYQYDSIAIVVFALLGASTITTFIVSFLLGIEQLEKRKCLSLFCALMGLGMFALQNSVYFNQGVLFACLAGCGYGLFLVLNNQFNIPVSGIPFLWLLLLIGAIILAIPFCLHHPSFPNRHNLLTITLLGLLPTVGGFYCTTKALSLVKATQVQLVELLEPVMASCLALLFYKQWLNAHEVIGAMLILFAIGLITLPIRKKLMGEPIHE